ncbi:MAG: protein translocase subunit SecF [Candidatus Woesearchaeota archaeon]|nr:protein translocase subunit SecF [Candidatus Woesearchaeota archaeon]
MLAVLLAAIIQVVYQAATTGDFINKGISLKGGLSLTIFSEKQMGAAEIENYLRQSFTKAEISVRVLGSGGKQTGIIIEASGVDENELLSSLQDKIGPLSKDQYTAEEMGSSLGQSFFRETITTMIFAFVLMGIVVFIYFRNLVPSSFVILCAFADIVMPLAVINLLGVKVSTAGIAAFLMLIGYSVDTDILLTTRVLKRKEGSILVRTLDAMKTGMTMSLTSFAAVVVAFIFTNSETIKQIMLILAIGLLFDIVNTWITNAGILRWYLEWKEKKRAGNESQQA